MPINLVLLPCYINQASPNPDGMGTINYGSFQSCHTTSQYHSRFKYVITSASADERFCAKQKITNCNGPSYTQ